MAVTKHGVSSNTPDRMIIGPGAVYIGSGDPSSPGTLLGATKGGNVFEVNRTIRDIRPDGSKGKVKGFRRVEEVEATLTVNLLEITEANLLYALPGAAASSHVITGAEIDDSDFITAVSIVGEVTGFTMTSDPIILTLSNCICEGPLSLNLNNNEEATIQLKFVAHFADSDLSTEPWQITYPST
jgi:hypothetical protein